MAEYAGDAAITNLGVETLAGLIINGGRATLRAAAANAGAPAVLVAALRNHARVPNLVYWTCMILSALADEKVGPERVPAVLEAGAPAAIVATLQTSIRPVDGHAVQACCNALYVLAGSSAGRDAIIEAGGAAALVAAARAVPKIEVAHGTCRALALIATAPLGIAATVEAGATATAVACLQAHTDSPEVAASASWLLWNLAAGSRVSKEAALRLGAVAALTAALAAYPTKDSVINNATGALKSLTDLKDDTPAGDSGAPRKPEEAAGAIPSGASAAGVDAASA